MNAKDVITLARQNVGAISANESSARLCLADAVALYDAGFIIEAKRRALYSLAYSLGKFSRVYVRASAPSFHN